LATKKGPPLIHNLVLMNTLIGGVIGAAMGVSGNFLLRLVGGLSAGALAGWAADIVLGKMLKAPKLYARRLLILVLSEVLLVFYFLVPFYRAYLITHPRRRPVTATPADLGLSYEPRLSQSRNIHFGMSP